MVKFDQLMSSVNIELLKLSALCGIICKVYTSSIANYHFPSLLFVICTPSGNKLINYSRVHISLITLSNHSDFWLVLGVLPGLRKGDSVPTFR